ncbi:MAG TPA: pilus assembly protein PilM [Paraburkholderia sp.]|jgi:Tfp pilus assembly PilM family ATPase
MVFRTSLVRAVRRFAAGIDISPQAVRLVVLSRRLRGDGPVRIECIASVPLRAGAMAGAEIVDRAAVAQAMCELFECLPTEHLAPSLRCAMAIPASATLTASVPLAQLAPRNVSLNGSHYVDRHLLATLEPAVMTEAERIAGIERHALAVDWFFDESPRRIGSVTIAATARQHLEARIECAAIAGVSLTAVDGEPHAALRAIRHAAALELDTHGTYVAIWVGADGVYGWRVADDLVAAEMRYPAPEYAGLADALRDVGGGCVIGCALVAGEIDLLDGVRFSLADIGDVLGCSVLPFQCAPLGDVVQPFLSELLQEPACAVAFGLALRGVIE